MSGAGRGRGRFCGRGYSPARLPRSLPWVLVQALVFHMMRYHQIRTWHAGGGWFHFSSERFVKDVLFFNGRCPLLLSCFYKLFQFRNNLSSALSGNGVLCLRTYRSNNSRCQNLTCLNNILKLSFRLDLRKPSQDMLLALLDLHKKSTIVGWSKINSKAMKTMKSLHVNRQDVMSDSHRQQQPRGIHNKEIAVML